MTPQELSPQLRERIDANIEKHRKTDFSIRLLQPNGVPLSGAKVHLEQQSHEFLFGSNLFMLGQLPTPELEEKYRKAILTLCNQATLPFYWEGTEPQEGAHRFEANAPFMARRPPAEPLIAFCKEHSLSMKGHAVVYHLFLPDWVTREPAKIPDLLLKRMDELGERFADTIPLWDAVNESNKTFDNPFQEAFGERDYVQWAFREIRKRFPKNQLILNETSWIAHSCLLVKGRYYHQARQLLEAGAPLDCIGFQWHLRHDFGRYLQGNHIAADLAKLYSYYENFGDLKLPTAITEITIPSSEEARGDPESQAAVVENLYRIWFSIPTMNRITYWNIGDGLAYGPENILKGGLLDEELNPKPAFTALDRLINQEWKTTLTATTDEEGKMAFRGFPGNYRISQEPASHNSSSSQLHLSSQSTHPAEITISPSS